MSSLLCPVGITSAAGNAFKMVVWAGQSDLQLQVLAPTPCEAQFAMELLFWSASLSQSRQGLLSCTATLLQVDRLCSGLERAGVERRAAIQAGEPSLVEVEVASSGVYRDAVDLALLPSGVGVSDLHALAASGLVVGSPGCGNDAVVVLEDVDEVFILWESASAEFGGLVFL